MPPLLLHSIAADFHVVLRYLLRQLINMSLCLTIHRLWLEETYFCVRSLVHALCLIRANLVNSLLFWGGSLLTTMALSVDDCGENANRTDRGQGSRDYANNRTR